MVKFEEVKKGYNKEQVDAYIKTINDEYQKVLAEYQTLEDELEEAKEDTSRKDAIASALINAEISGKQVVARAQLEAKRIIIEAEREVSKITEEKKSVLEQVDKLSKMLNYILNVYSNEEQDKKDKAQMAKK